MKVSRQLHREDVGLSVLRSYIRVLLEGNKPGSTGPAAQPQVEKPSAEPSPPTPQQKTRERLSEAITFANELDNNLLIAFQADVDVPFYGEENRQEKIEQTVTEKILEAANKDTAFPNEFPLCTAIVLCAIDTGDLDTGPAFIGEVYEGIKSIGVKEIKESYRKHAKKVLKESLTDEAVEAYLKKVLSEVFDALAKKKLVALSSEVEINKFVRELVNGRAAQILYKAQNTDAKVVIRSMFLEGVRLDKIPSLVADLDLAIKAGESLVARDSSLSTALDGLKSLKRAGKVYDASGPSVLQIGSGADDLIQSFNRLQAQDQIDVLTDASLSTTPQDFRAALGRIVRDEQSLAKFADDVMTNDTLLKSLIKTTGSAAMKTARKAWDFSWDATKSFLSAVVEAFFPSGSGKYWLRGIAASSTVGALWQFADESPQLRREYRQRLMLADALVIESYKAWARGADFDEIADKMETVFSATNASLNSAIAIVRKFDEKRDLVTGSDVAVAQ